MSTVINPRADTIGFKFKFNLVGENGEAFNLTGFSAVVIFRNPSEVIFERDGVITSPATLGQVTYITQDGDLTESGTWRVQIRITDSVKVYWTTIQKVKVGANL